MGVCRGLLLVFQGGQQRALKVISGALGLSKAVLRFRREAEAEGKIHHTNIVLIYATG